MRTTYPNKYISHFRPFLQEDFLPSQVLSYIAWYSLPSNLFESVHSGLGNDSQFGHQRGGNQFPHWKHFWLFVHSSWKQRQIPNDFSQETEFRSYWGWNYFVTFISSFLSVISLYSIIFCCTDNPTYPELLLAKPTKPCQRFYRSLYYYWNWHRKWGKEDGNLALLDSGLLKVRSTPSRA